LRAIVRLIRK